MGRRAVQSAAASILASHRTRHGLIRLLPGKGSEVFFHDPFCTVILCDAHTTIKHLPIKSVDLSEAMLKAMDCIMVITDHITGDYQKVAEHAHLVDAGDIVRQVNGGAQVAGLSGSRLSASGQPFDLEVSA